MNVSSNNSIEKTLDFVPQHTTSRNNETRIDQYVEAKADMTFIILAPSTASPRYNKENRKDAFSRTERKCL